ncbi:HEAT repeat domain-containing protein [Plantactinospora solaniradicis]|uniref:HEAT repeat domain-containing protein n=1 Tax=Plantactinospora solaniradicis TaxID=1723736 RepID=A0ABW1K9I1_9ACTN
MTWLKRLRRPRGPAGVDPDARLAPVRTAIDEVAGRGRPALDRLVDQLADLDAVGDDATALAALELLGGRPRVVSRLDEHARRTSWYSPHHSTVLDRLPERLDAGAAGPIAMALASTHRDGRIRERAVTAILDRPGPELMPFLVLRTGDWVGQVRNRARAGLALLLADDPNGYLPATVPTALVVQFWRRGGFAYTQALAALLTAPTEVRQALAGSAGRHLRRFVFDTALTQRWLHLDELVAAAESEGDVRIRARAAEAACREAVWTRRIGVLQRLAGSRRADVRVLALTGLVRTGHDAEVAGYLDDPAPLVRAVARDAARRLGTDLLAYYLGAVADPVPAIGAIAGLAEMGSDTAVPLLRPLLAHPSASVRARAVWALRQLEAVDVEGMVPLLRDPSPAVVRETTAALRPFHRRVPPELGWRLLADPRTELRRAGYRLLRDRSTAVRLRAGLLLAMDPYPELARRGRADVTGLVRATNLPARRRALVPELLVTAAEHADLTELARRAAGTLGADTTGLLSGWLAGAVPTQRSGT